MKHLGSLESTQEARVAMPRATLMHLSCLQTSHVLHISMNACWCMNQLLISPSFHKFRYAVFIGLSDNNRGLLLLWMYLYQDQSNGGQHTLRYDIYFEVWGNKCFEENTHCFLWQGLNWDGDMNFAIWSEIMDNWITEVTKCFKAVFLMKRWWFLW